MDRDTRPVSASSDRQEDRATASSRRLRIDRAACSSATTDMVILDARDRGSN